MKRVLILECGGEPPHSKWFTAEELAVADAFKLGKRREEWLLSRVAAKQLALDLGLCDDPRDCIIDRPRLKLRGQTSEWFVSVSHSAPYAGAILGREPVGIDVQVVRDLNENAAHLFLSDEEADAMRRCAIDHRMIHFWCAKEAAWKQRSSEFVTMRQCPLSLRQERSEGLRFDCVETEVRGDLIVATTLPTS